MRQLHLLRIFSLSLTLSICSAILYGVARGVTPASTVKEAHRTALQLHERNFRCLLAAGPLFLLPIHRTASGPFLRAILRKPGCPRMRFPARHLTSVFTLRFCGPIRISRESLADSHLSTNPPACRRRFVASSSYRTSPATTSDKSLPARHLLSTDAACRSPAHKSDAKAPIHPPTLYRDGAHISKTIPPSPGAYALRPLPICRTALVSPSLTTSLRLETRGGRIRYSLANRTRSPLDQRHRIPHAAQLFPRKPTHRALCPSHHP
ncbi:hypothetical protein B0H19DRAFT_1276225 [Mycena capillaripes]|nr:hypothetical protein B0H19DRAFT_1276225 [Mycena capillaripes]